MVKYIYRSIISFFIFCAALVFFTVNQGGTEVKRGEVVDISAESYPVLQAETQGIAMNRMYGYSGSIAPNIVRLSMTPLNESKKMKLQFHEGEKKIQKFKYQLLDKETLEIYEEKDIQAVDENAKGLEIAFQYAMNTSTEYILSMTATLSSGEKIHYYTRLKYYITDTYLKEKLDFVMMFHELTFDKDKVKEIGGFLESNATEANDNLARVNIHSSVDLVTWGKLKPELASKIVPVVKEFNTETACIQLVYYVKGTTSAGEETFLVKEFFRVRHASGHDYLLGYERTMEAGFNEQYASTTKSQLKIGITQDNEMDLVTSKDKKQLYFARNGILYHYNMAKGENKISEIFRTFSKNADEIYTLNAENDIQINKLDSDGNLYFTVYGYIPRGEYEGKVAVVLYCYHSSEEKLEEIVYLPMDSTYQQLKEDFNPYSYVNSNNVYYLTVANVVYAYHITANRLDTLVEDVKENSFVVLKNNNCLAWSSDLENGYGESITIYNLENDVKTELKAPKPDENIRLLGTIDSNVIYGYVKKNQVTKRKDGTKIVPCYKMEIADIAGTVLKSYEKKDVYITNIDVNGNVLTMERKRNSSGHWVKTSSDSILNQESQEKAMVSLVSRVTTGALTEYYITLPYGFVLTKAPLKIDCVDRVTTSEHAVHLKTAAITKYYVYAMGRITGAFEDPAKAIAKADEEMGSVISSHHQIVWERGGSFTMNTVGGVSLQKASSEITCISACAYMVLKANHYSVSASELSKSGLSVYDMLAKYMHRPVNLSGITLDQMLYFVSSDKPVIAMTGSNSAVVVIGYTPREVSVYNPNLGKEETYSMSNAKAIFKRGGNRFISYMHE